MLLPLELLKSLTVALLTPEVIPGGVSILTLKFHPYLSLYFLQESVNFSEPTATQQEDSNRTAKSWIKPQTRRHSHTCARIRKRQEQIGIFLMFLFNHDTICPKTTKLSLQAPMRLHISSEIAVNSNKINSHKQVINKSVVTSIQCVMFRPQDFPALSYAEWSSYHHSSIARTAGKSNIYA